MIVCPANQTVNTEVNQKCATVVFIDPQVTDNSGQISTITCDVESGSLFRIGLTEVMCQASDQAGNLGTCVFTVQIEGTMTCIIFLSLLLYYIFQFWKLCRAFKLIE